MISVHVSVCVHVAVDTVKEAGLALNRTAYVMPVHQGGMALAVTSRVLQVIMAIAAKRFVHVAETWTHVTQKLERAYTVILVGLDRGTDLLGFSSERKQPIVLYTMANCRGLKRQLKMAIHLIILDDRPLTYNLKSVVWFTNQITHIS